jgi:hypothetical protein
MIRSKDTWSLEFATNRRKASTSLQENKLGDSNKE